ncbi:response regulator [Atopomonas sediminilitoris]|uniref:response regulator n=1 Tax=Atopomonas sediminilitoris TaxID=2919919 RepID=UPI001F4E5D2E|nr:response regulator [Atopomonas sediminilitoris]MCJ8170597.1 response regulator [Atopomonas sediminilitoris]
MSDTAKRILIVEDEPKLAQLLAEYLAAAGFATVLLSRGDQVLDWLAEHTADLLILDVMLPGVDGLALCRMIRQQCQVPIIMATARVEEASRLQGLEQGADDYVCKPYSLREMVARVKTILRRVEVSSTPIAASEAVFHVDTAMMSINLHGQPLGLTRVEFRLLHYFINHPQVVIARDDLLNVIYDDYRLVSERTVDTHVKNLRKKIQHHLPEQDVIRAVYGLGYVFQAPSA